MAISLNKSLTLLLIIFIILLIFCFMQVYVYKSKNFVFDENDENDGNENSNSVDIKKNIKYNILILIELIKNSKTNIREKFDNNNITITDSEARRNLGDLEALSVKLDTVDLNSISDTINSLKNKRIENKDKILKLLTSIYILRYLEIVNKTNAVSYKEFLKYQNIKNNKYYL
jgi:hypothetical protein